MRLRNQLALVVTAVVALIVAVAGLFVVVRIDNRDAEALDREISARADRVRVTASTDGTFASDGSFVARLVRGGQLVKQIGSPAGFPLPVPEGYATVRAGDEQWRSLGETLPSGVQLQVLMSQRDLDVQHRSNVRIVVLLVVLAALLSAAGVWFATGYMLRPFQRLLTSARELDPADPSQRLPEVSSPREVAELTSTLNGLLDRARGSAPLTEPPPVSPPPVSPPPVSPPPVSPPPVSPPPVSPPPVSQPPVSQPPAFAAETVEIPKIIVKQEGPDLSSPLAGLGANLDALLDNPDMPATQRHLILAAMADEHRRMVALIAEQADK
ncbi:HAMP domain-containing protein [Paractinoplanes deccanensis]|uniref:HAMP domain-containing protein n=1 Tax=Paractinoplanes deccanensis TaxID=113561 RepID=UPI0036156EED